MNELTKTLAIVFILTILAFTAVWIYYIRIGQKMSSTEGGYEPLRIISYPTFVSSYGPGPTLAALFEKRCQCRVELLSAGESGLIIDKILARGDDYAVDVVVGLDQFTAAKGLKQLEWRKFNPHGSVEEASVFLPLQESLWPFNWSPLTFIYKASKVQPPRTLKDLRDPRFQASISLQNPLTSTPGVHFFHWILSAFGPEESLKFFNALASQKFVFADSWSRAYGLFQKGDLKMTFSYLTSVAYHWVEEKNEDFQPAVLEEPHPIQVEYMGVPARCRRCKDAEDFVAFLLEPGSQSLIMQKNYMLPVIQSVVQGTVFEKLPRLKTLPVQSTMDEEWLQSALKSLRSSQ